MRLCARGVVGDHAGDVAVGDVGEPDSDGFGDAVDADVADAGQGLGESGRSGLPGRGRPGRGPGPRGWPRRAGARPGWGTGPVREDLLAWVCTASTTVTPTALPWESSSDSAAAIRFLASRSVTYAGSEASSSTTTRFSGSSGVGVCSRVTPRSADWRRRITAQPARNSRSPRGGLGPTDCRPPARSNTSTAPWRRAGPSRSSTTPSRPDSQPCQHGSTSTTTTGPTPRSGSAHPSPGWTTWLGITARWPISTASASGRMKSTRAKVMANRTLGTHGVGSAGDSEPQASSAGTTHAIGGRFTLLDGARRDRAANPGRMGDLDLAGLAPR
jgi:hypothetical protein